jgi:Rad3-related DNA helicase
MNHHWLTWEELKSHFPRDGEFKDGMRPAQETALRFVADKGSSVLELPPGEGKTAMEVAICRVAKKHFKRAFLVTPSKTIVAQIKERFPDDFTVALGRNDFPCFFYETKKASLTRDSETKFKANEIPCSMLTSCPHRVNQETGETHEEGAIPCPYLKQKYEARISRKPVLSTLAFYLFSRLFSKDFPAPDVLVIDEGHRVPETVRSALSYDITDWHLAKAVEILDIVEEREAAKTLGHFLSRMRAIVKRKQSKRGTLLDSAEIIELVSILDTVDSKAIERSVAKALKNDSINVDDNVEVLKKVEGVVRNLRRYVRSLELSLPMLGQRGALAYTYAYHKEELSERERVENKLVVCSHYVAPLVKRMLGTEVTITLSATIGDEVIFGHESGIVFPFLSLPPSFPAENTRIFMPTDTPNLAYNERKSGAVTNVMRRLARGTKKLAKNKIRSLHLTVSNEEREHQLRIMDEEGVDAVSYMKGFSPREAALVFKEGAGDTLVGTSANFGEGVDLPRQIAGVIFGLRPSYPPPDDPRTQFEERRYGNQRWAIWNWRVMLSILQWRGRNIRSADDFGVIIFISQQYRRSVFASLPKSLQPSYRGELTFDQCINEAVKLLNPAS